MVEFIINGMLNIVLKFGVILLFWMCMSQLTMQRIVSVTVSREPHENFARKLHCKSREWEDIFKLTVGHNHLLDVDMVTVVNFTASNCQ